MNEPSLRGTVQRALVWSLMILPYTILWFWWHQYEFHKTLEGRQEILWSCNRVTGECKEVET